MKLMIKVNIFVLLISIFFLNNVNCQANKTVKTGIEVLRSTGFKKLANKNVGLITNPTGVDSKMKSTVDILYEAENVNLVALFGPEHGVRGDVSAGEKINSSIDPKTGVPVYSLYGKTRKPTPEMLKNIDVLIYDIQDIGCRSYTYISTMGLAMEAAAENDVEFMVLDRPNPLGGEKIEGPVAEKPYFSLVGAYPIPYVYGLTVGELATLINEEKMLENGRKCKLTVVRMDGWHRNMHFDDTGLPWVPSSPHIPYSFVSYYYVATGILGELMVINNGVGYTLPFQLLGEEWIEGDKIAKSMNSLGLDGIEFRPLTYKPYYTKWAKKNQGGIQLYITEPDKINLMSIQFLFLQELHKLYPDKDIFEMSKNRHKMFNKVCGSDKILNKFFENYNYDDIKGIMVKDIEDYKKMASKYYLYD
ncbi:MAG TPA: DUF1343 domain-containing protein [Bacteroidetes bacterium]|nr:DUF1343 domain-containing protein [Bacteroidota bacterium]